jgi:hypothetical protein
VISPEDTDFQFDTGRGGVRLAQESAVGLQGTVKPTDGNTATATFQELVRYTSVREVTEQQVQDTFQKVGAKLICTGQGQELYQDPGTTLEKIVILAPVQAAQDASRGASPVPDNTAKIVINVLGGDDLQFLEVKDALELLVPKLANIGSKTQIQFHSLCHTSFPLEQVTITVVALPNEASSNGMSGALKSIANGQVYFRDGPWWTVAPEDINTALA